MSRFNVLIVQLCLFSAMIAGCLQQPQPEPKTKSLAIATINDASGSFKYLDDAKNFNVAIAASVRPEDFLWVTAVTSKSLMERPLVFPPAKARTVKEMNRFIHRRDAFADSLCNYFERLKKRPARNSDIFQSIEAASGVLHRIEADRKVLLVFSDFDDNIRRKLTADFRGYHVLALYVYPSKSANSEFRSYMTKIERTLSACKPDSLVVLSPNEAASFDLKSYIQILRGTVL